MRKQAMDEASAELARSRFDPPDARVAVFDRVRKAPLLKRTAHPLALALRDGCVPHERLRAATDAAEQRANQHLTPSRARQRLLTNFSAKALHEPERSGEILVRVGSHVHAHGLTYGLARGTVIENDLLEKWSRFHAIAMLAVGAFAAFARNTAPLTLAAALSFLVLVGRGRGGFTLTGAFGLANWVTLVRLTLVLGLPFVPAPSFGPTVVVALMLDGLDGAIARRLGLSSAFGAHFDMETDAVLVALVSSELWARGLTGAWVLSSGALRYVYVVSVWLIPASGGEAPRTAWGRYSFLVLALGLTAPWLLGTRIGAPLAAFGCAVVAFSFARSFAYSYRLLR